MPSSLLLTPAYKTVLSSFHLFPLHAPITLFGLNAPHGKFALENSRLNLNGKLAWFSMEIVSPSMALYTLYTSLKASSTSLSPPTLLLLVLYLIHYANRSTISVLRSEGMADSHIAPWLAAVGFNSANGFLLGRYLSMNPTGPDAFSNPIYWAGVTLWVVGWAGNVAHDEILLSLRRRSRLLSSFPSSVSSTNDSSKKSKPLPASSNSITIPSANPAQPFRTYFIPDGGLFRFVSFPHYLCEIIEWTGFALACSSPIIVASTLTAEGFFQPGLVSAGGWRLLTPAWVFVINEIAALVPRALAGHTWYKEKFGKRMPKGRKAIVPFLL
ncbi:hypothetical protein BDY24DRAFT_388779 [Mrakia frigida]|uniref:uncharacterized protein n=1 Tax=Mrakia frigida TaxID=29902 RepID=UPI003FCBF448